MSRSRSRLPKRRRFRAVVERHFDRFAALERVLREYVAHYHAERPNQGLDRPR